MRAKSSGHSSPDKFKCVLLDVCDAPPLFEDELAPFVPAARVPYPLACAEVPPALGYALYFEFEFGLRSYMV